MPNLLTFSKELLIFTLNQARASIFGASLLCTMILITLWDTQKLPLGRYDILFLAAICIQAYLIIRKHESLREIKVIFIFHIIATIMELFKTHPAIGSWRYSDTDNIFIIATVPLFTGFLYSAVGSYIARAWRIFHLQFTHFPCLRSAALLSTLIYINFFTHHFIYDIRWILFGAAFILFYKTKVSFRLVKTVRSMPLLIGFSLIAFFLYIAENIGTLLRIWTYPNQEITWHLVPFGKYGSWLLLIIVSFTLVSMIYRQKLWKNA